MFFNLKVNNKTKCKEECYKEDRCILALEYPNEDGCRINIVDLPEDAYNRIQYKPNSGYKMHIYMTCDEEFEKNPEPPKYD